jgi:putative FmdB family regulatory protein
VPLYEYYCDGCDKIFETLQAISKSDQPAPCADCGRAADRIMPTMFATMARRKGLKERVPYHHHDVRDENPQRAIARVKPKAALPRTAQGKVKKG